MRIFKTSWLVLIFLFLLCCSKKGLSPLPIPYTSWDGYPSWSSDGKTVAYVHPGANPGEYGIYLIDTTGSNKRFLIQGGGDEDWSPNDSFIFYTKAYTAEIYKINLSTLETAFLADNATNPRISRDGAMIIYEGGVYLWVMDENGANKRKLNITGGNPFWSPDGMKLVFDATSGPYSFPQIYIADSSGENRIALTNDDRYNSRPVWSPDGDKIAWDSQKSGTIYPEIWIMKSDGSQKYFLTIGSEHDWSPDAKKIVYAAPENGLKGKEVIWIINIDGTGRKQITF